MHQIRFLLVLRSSPRWGSLQRFPAGLRGPTSKGRGARRGLGGGKGGRERGAIFSGERKVLERVRGGQGRGRGVERERVGPTGKNPLKYVLPRGNL